MLFPAFTNLPSPSVVGEVLFFDSTTTDSSPAITWLWDFGDGNTDTVQNPTHTYSTFGTMIVVLEVGDGSTTYRIQTSLFISRILGNPFDTILQMVNHKIPSTYMSIAEIQTETMKWFGLLNLTVEPPLSKFDEANYPFNWRVLIAELIVYDNIQRVVEISVVQNIDNITNIGSIESSLSGKGNTVKTMEMGPSKAEFHNNYADRVDMMSAFMKAFISNKGLMDSLKENICNISESIGIKLYFCKDCKKGGKLITNK